MRAALCAKILLSFCATSLLLLGPPLARGQEASSSAAAPPSDVQVLAEAVRSLGAQVQSLNAQMSELRAEQRQALEDARELRAQLGAAKIQLAAMPVAPRAPTLTSSSSLPPVSTSAPPQSSSDRSNEDRLTKIEEDQQLAEAKLTDLSQTKIESGSKYRLRLSGLVLLNAFVNRGVVDNIDFPEVASPQGLLDSRGSFGGSLRQSQVGIQAFGPEIFGARTSADLKFDFAGGFPETPNGASMGVVRLRTGTIRFDWARTSVIAGQDRLFFAPLAPTSLASLAVPALSYSGNLWSWTPQIRIEHRLQLAENSSLLLQGGILDSFSGDVFLPQQARPPTWGEQSGQPAYAARVALTQRAFGQNLTLGFGGYYGRQDWGFDRKVDSWASTTDLTIPLGEKFEFTGAFYRGRSLGGLGGGITQSILWNGSFVDPATSVHGLDSTGGWLQLKFKPTQKLELNAAIGEDNPFASELRRFSANSSYYGSSFSKNISPLFNFIYQVRSDVLFSVEYRHLHTTLLDTGANRANLVNLSLGYTF